jgi:predicted PurR-regulated permease PerM
LNEDRTRPLSNPFVARAARWGLVAWSAIGVLILGYILFRYVVHPIRIIFAPLVVAVIVVYLLNPVVTALERRGVRRGWGALFVYLIFAGVFGTGLYFLIPVVVEQAGEFGRAAPRIFTNIIEGFENLLRNLGVQDAEAAAPATDSIVDVLGSIFSFTRGLFDVVLVMVLGPILAFYLLVDLPKVKRNVRAMVPARRRREVEAVTQRIGKSIGAYFRGQLLVAAFVAVASGLTLWIVGLPYWAIVGLVTGLFNLVPLIGPFIGGAVAIVIAITTDQSGGLLNIQPGWPLALASAVGLLIVQQIDNHVISPNMIGRTVRLHPVTVMLGLLVGGALLGLWGMLLAIPVIATIKILILHAWDTRMTWPPAVGEPRAAAEPERPSDGMSGDGPDGTGGPREASAVAPVDAPEPMDAPAPAGTGSHTRQRSRWWGAVRSVLGGRRPAVGSDGTDGKG